MGRSYAAALGCLALAASILHGLIHSQSPEPVLTRSIFALIAFAGLGWIVGQAADYAVRHSVEMRFRIKVERWRQKNSNNPQASPTSVK